MWRVGEGGLPWFCFILMLGSSCVLSPESDPGYPVEYDCSYQTDSIGGPSSCSFSSDGLYLTCACDGGLLTAELGRKEVLIPTAAPLTDAAFFRGTHTVCAASGESLLVAGPGSEQSWMDAGAGVLFVEPSGDGMLAVLADGSMLLAGRDLSIMRAGDVPVGAPLSAIVLGSDLFLGFADSLARLDAATGTVELSVGTMGAVADLFDAGAGMLGASIQGTNMLWILDPVDLSAVLLVTFPGFPAEGAATPDGIYFYAGGDASLGLYLASSSGELVWSSPGFGETADLAFSPDSLHVMVASGSNNSILVMGY